MQTAIIMTIENRMNHFAMKVPDYKYKFVLILPAALRTLFINATQRFSNLIFMNKSRFYILFSSFNIRIIL